MAFFFGGKIMAWFWSPKYKRKYEIVGFKTKDEMINPKEAGFSKIIRIYYKDEHGDIVLDLCK